MKNNRAQAWGFDLLVGVAIFIAGVVFFFIYSLNIPNEGVDNIERLFYEGNLIGDSLLTEGFPEDWDVSNVVRIGITDNEKINQTKLEILYNMTNGTNGYALSKSLFNVDVEYFFNFSNQMTVQGVNVQGIGRAPTNEKNLIKITRLTIYEDEPVTLTIFIWEP